MKRYKLIACKVLQREIASCLVRTKNFIDLTFIRQEYHEIPKNLVDILQEEIDMVESGKDVHSGEYNNPLRMKKLDAILLGYGLCSNALVGLRAKSLPLVVPRAHDCTTLLMGSKEAYREYFDTVKGTSFITRGWVDNGKNFEEKDLDRIRAMYMEKYQDEDTVDMLMEFEQESMAGYSVLTGIYWAVVTITTVGYGDVVPVTVAGRFLSVLIMLLGYSIIAVPTGIVAGETINEYRRPRKSRRLQELEKDFEDEETEAIKN